MMYLDTNILIYLLEQHETYSEAVAQTLEEATQDSGTLITSAITVTEFLAGTASSSLETLRKVPQLQFISLDDSLAEQAALLQRKNNLQIGDAIHLATALGQQADTFFTNDKHLAKIAKSYLAVQQL
jgi:predicted nucleic acid-binding protein